MKKAVTLTGVVLMAALVPVFAGALEQRMVDRNDSEGLLDVRELVVTGDSKTRWLVTTFNGWRVQDVTDRAYLLIFLDTFGDDRADYYALVRSTGSRLRADLFRDRRNRADLRVARLKVGRPSNRKVAVKISLDDLRIDDGRLTYSWFVQTLFTGRRCRRVCFDLVPDAGSVQRPVPGVTPSPSPIPTLTQ